MRGNRFGMIALLVGMFGTAQALASTQQNPVFTYYDCVPGPLVPINVFAQWPSGYVSEPSSYYTKGEVFSVLSDGTALNNIQGFKIGNAISFTLGDLKAGIYFGVAPNPIHIMQADPKFNTETGGTIHFHYLTSFSATGTWGSFDIVIKRLNGRWASVDMGKVQFNHLFAQMTAVPAAPGAPVFVPTGIKGMFDFQSSPLVPNASGHITVFDRYTHQVVSCFVK